MIKMKIVEKIYDECLVLEPTLREDSRGLMQVFYSRSMMAEYLPDFEVKEQRLYTMPRKNTFFGIHYQNRNMAKGKLISVIQGSGLDYIVDLRRESDTFKQYRVIKLSGNLPRLVFVPAGFGHGFLSLEDNTIQAFAIDVEFGSEHSGVANYKDPDIGIKLPTEDVIISEYDRDAEFFT